MLKKVLIPWIKSTYPNKKILFWPDGTTAHYVKGAQETLETAKISYIGKTENPPNVPQLRPIERFWAHMKWEYVDVKKETKTDRQLKNVWKKISETYGFGLMRRLRLKTRLVGRHGVYALINKNRVIKKS